MALLSRQYNKKIDLVVIPTNNDDAVITLQIDAGSSETINLSNGGSGGTTTLTNAHIFVGNSSNVATDRAMSGDASIANTGAVTVTNVGGSSASSVNAATALANAATSSNTVSTIVKRDGSGNFSAGTITANLTGDASGTAANVTGTVAVAHGGTNSTTALNNNRVIKSSGGAIVEAAAITASRAVISDSNGIPTHATTTSTEIGYVNGVTSAIQTQIDSKQATGNYITALTGDVTASGPGSVAATLATVNSNVGSFGSSTSIPTLTVTGKGLVTAASGNAVVAPAGTLTGATLAEGVTASSLTSVGTLTSGTWNGTTIAIGNGGTGQTTQQTAIDALTGTQSSGKYLRSDGTHATLTTIQAGDVPTLNQDTTGNANTATTATNATNVATTATNSTNSSFFPTFVASSSSGNQGIDTDTGLTYNPSSNTLTTTTFSGALTGTASGNTTYTANNHGVVLSGSGNTMTVVAPDASTTKVLTSGGSSADPSWQAVPSAPAAVVASYYMSGNTSTTTANPVNFDTKIVDTDNAVTTGSSWKFTAPSTGYYSVMSNISGGIDDSMTVYLNGTNYMAYGETRAGQASNAFVALISMSASDYIDIRPGATITVNGGALNSYQTSTIHIFKIH